LLWRVLRAIASAIVLAVLYALGRRPHETAEERTRASRSSAGAAAAFGVSFAGSVVLAIVYALGGQPQLEGAMLFVALGGLSVGLVQWSRRLMPQGPHVEARELLPGEAHERAEAEEAFSSGVEEIKRRRFLGKLLAAAVAAFGATLVFPIRSLGTRPGESLYRTAWRRGVRAVTEDGTPVRAVELVDNTVLTVFPEGHTDAADAQAVLIKVPADLFRPARGRETWSPERIVAFSKICTHAGCPVGLYQAETAQLFCPCHQSAFDVPRGAAPVAGPATRPLPQLPLAIDQDGFIVARSDFHEPVGPAFWNMGRR
jgi:ubiquinol-cytochrome c reductase iron-sulfur subunit